MNSHTELSALKVGESGRVLSLRACDRQYRHKLLMMGLTRGTEVTVVRAAPLGDPIEIRVRDSTLSVRRGEVKGVEVERIVGAQHAAPDIDG